MKQFGTNFLVATLAGFAGAGIYFFLFADIPVIAQEQNNNIVTAHKFVLLNQKNEPVGVFAVQAQTGLPFLSLEGMHGEGTILVGFLGPGNPQVRLRGENGKGGAGFSVFEGSGVFSLWGKGEEIIRILPEHSKAWNQMLERFKSSQS